MEESGYNPIIQSTTGNNGGIYFNIDSSSLKTSTIEIIKNEIMVDNTLNPVVTELCPSMK